MKKYDSETKWTVSKTGKKRRVDRRTIRTKRAILTALFGAMENKDIEKVTITEIAEAADIDRKTFYLHYNGIQDVIKEFEDNLVATTMAFVHEPESKGTAEAFFNGLNHTITTNLEFVRYFVKSGAYNYFMNKVSEAFREYVYENVENSERISSEHDKQLLSAVLTNLATGTASMYIAWLQGESSVDIDELGQTARTMAAAAVVSVKDRIGTSMPELYKFFGC